MRHFKYKRLECVCADSEVRFSPNGMLEKFLCVRFLMLKDLNHSQQIESATFAGIRVEWTAIDCLPDPQHVLLTLY